MKEKDIVDFTKLEKDSEEKIVKHEDFCGRSDANYVQMLAQNNAFKQALVNCPVCGKLVNAYYINKQAVSEEGGSDPNSNSLYWPVTRCLECFTYFAWVPTTIFYDDRDEIYHIKGMPFIIDAPGINLDNKIIKLIKPSNEQTINGKIDEHNNSTIK